MRKRYVLFALAVVLFITNPDEKSHQREFAGNAAFLGDFGDILVSNAADYVNFGIFSSLISKRTEDILTIGFLGHVFRI